MPNSFSKKITPSLTGRLVYLIMIIICLTLVGVMTISVSRLNYNNLRDESTQENYSWAVAKFAIKLAEFDASIAHILRNPIGDKKNIQLQLDILFSRLKVIQDKTSSTRWLYKEPDYKHTVDIIQIKLNDLNTLLNSHTPDYQKISDINLEIKPFMYQLANIADHAEVRQRDQIYQKSLNAKHKLINLIYIVSAIGLIIALINTYHYFKIDRLLADRKKALKNTNAFLGMLCHELRTSLQVIFSGIDLISQGIKKDDIALSLLENAARQMDGQMTDLSEYASVESHNIKFTNQPFNLSKAIKTVIMECDLRFNKNNVTIIDDIETDLLINADQQRFCQIAENLLSNALKYTEKGTVCISCHSVNKNTIELKVVDTGIGISQDKLESIFSPFVRCNESSTAGFGIGLAIVAGLLNHMKGKISVKSKCGHGSEFQLRIPVMQVNLDEFENISSPQLSNILHTKNKLNILIIDDNREIGQSLASLLRQHGDVVDVVITTERANQKLLRKPYDVVICDIQMPGMNGDIFFSLVRSRPSINQFTPFVFITAYSITSSLLCEDVRIISKPVRFTVLEQELLRYR